MTDIADARVVIIAWTWILADVDMISRRRGTDWPSIHTDLRNAGAEVVDEQLVADGNLITCSKPDDVPAFSDALTRAIETV